MTDEPRDELDRALGVGLGRLGGDAPDADAALAALHPRFRRARTRARVARASVVALVVLGSAAVALAGTGRGKHQVSVAASTTTGSERSSTSTSVHQRRPTTTTEPSLPPSRTTLPTSPRTMGTVPLGGGNGGGGPSSPTTSAPTTTTVPPPGMNHTYNADGGRMTVRFSNGRLTLVSYQPADGWTAAVHTNKPDDVEVRFSKGEEDSRIRVRVENGRLVRVDE
jgi:hypothetical protein